MATTTSNFGFTKPAVADPVDADIWGGQLNTNWDTDDTQLKVARDFIVDSSKTSTPYTMVAGNRNQLIPVDATSAPITVDLLLAATAGDGFEVAVKKTDSSSNAVTLDGSGSETIDGATTLVLSDQNDVARIVCDGTNWQAISRVGLVDKAVTLAKMADQTRGDLITYGASGVAQVTTLGSSGQVVTSDGTDSIWQDGPGVTLISSSTASAVANINFTSFRDDTLYRNYLLIGSNIIMAGVGNQINMRTSTDGGVGYDSSAGNYAYTTEGKDTAGTLKTLNSISATFIQIAEGIDTSTPLAISVKLFTPALAAQMVIQSDANYELSTPSTFVRLSGMGVRLAAADVDAFQIITDSLTFSGEFELYGLRI